jgi:hypothetical protein
MPSVKLHNAHVVKWYRFRIWLARQMCKPLKETFLIEWHNEELAKGQCE